MCCAVGGYQCGPPMVTDEFDIILTDGRPGTHGEQRADSRVRSCPIPTDENRGARQEVDC